MPLPERALISRIRKMSHSARVKLPAGAGVVAGIGDDSAVLRNKTGRDVLVTTDFTLEGIHFRRDWHPAESVGHRCVTRGLSDIAAMAGEPLACFLSLGLPNEIPQEWVDEFFAGFLGLAKKFRIPLAGGD